MISSSTFILKTHEIRQWHFRRYALNVPYRQWMHPVFPKQEIFVTKEIILPWKNMVRHDIRSRLVYHSREWEVSRGSFHSRWHFRWLFLLSLFRFLLLRSHLDIRERTRNSQWLYLEISSGNYQENFSKEKNSDSTKSAISSFGVVPYACLCIFRCSSLIKVGASSS